MSNQKLEISEFARKQELQVHEFEEITISSLKNSKQRRVDELLEKLNDADTLIVAELSRLGRSIAEVIVLINALIKSNIRVLII